MPRDSGSGVASPPANTIPTPASPVASDPMARILQDIYAILNAPVPVTYGGTGQTTYAGLLAAIGALPLAGGTLTGALTLSADPSAALQPVTKQMRDTDLATKAAVVHTHVAADVTDFSTATNAIVAATSINALSDVAITSPVTNDILKWNGTNFVNVAGNLYTDYDKGTFTLSTRVTQTHGLGRLPARFEIFFQCITTDNEWAVGDWVPMTSMLFSGPRLPIYMNTTEVGISPRTGDSVNISQKISLGDGPGFTASRWKMIFRVYS